MNNQSGKVETISKTSSGEKKQIFKGSVIHQVAGGKKTSQIGGVIGLKKFRTNSEDVATHPKAL